MTLTLRHHLRYRKGGVREVYKIKEVSELAGVSVRTLHYYDEIDLLKPAHIEENGYRLYNEGNLARLQQILFFKEMDLPLNKIKAILDDPQFDQLDSLMKHKKVLVEKQKRLEKIIQSIDQTAQAIKGGREMSKQDMFEPFDMSRVEEHLLKYEKEVKEKYADTEAFRQSKQKTNGYQADDWKTIEIERQRIYQSLADLMDRDPADSEVQQIIHEWRMHISKHFYDCTPEIFKGLGEMYISDQRFTDNIDSTKPGLARYLHDAIQIYCR